MHELDGVQILGRRRRREGDIRRLRQWQRQQFWRQLQECAGAMICAACGTFTALVWASVTYGGVL